MAIVTIEDTNLTNIADAIRSKNGTSDTYKPSEMANAINNIITSEDLSVEFNNYETYLTTQETTIEDIIVVLENKTGGGSGGGNTTMLTDVGEELFNVNRLIVEMPDLNTSEATYIHIGEMPNLIKLPNMDMSQATQVSFYGLPKITEISSLNLPVCKQLEIGDMENLETVGELNGFKPVNPVNLFYNCPNLTTIPVIDFSNVSSMMFAGGVFGYDGPSCPNLSDESLNNFLASLLTIQQNIMTKTLSEMGLDENQVARCQTLSNWEALQAKGWSV